MLTNFFKDLSNNNTLDLSNNNTLDLSNNNTLDLSNNNTLDLSNNITCICLSSGGILGLSFIGAIKKLIDEKIIYMENINLLVGTSAGALFLYFMNIGYSLNEFYDLILKFNFLKLNSEVDCINLLENLGIDNGNKFKLLLTTMLEKKYNIKDINFEDLYKLTNKKLIVIGTNISKMKEAKFSVDDTPKFSVITAIRISMSIPIVFTPIKIDNEYYVDGALLNNFPFCYCPPNNTIGLFIENKEDRIIDSISSLVKACIVTVINNVNKNINNKNIIYINRPDEEFELFNLTEDKKLILLDLGKTCVEKFLQNLNTPIN